MTQQISNLRSSFTTLTILPFMLILAITLGCNPADEDKSKEKEQDETITLELVDAETIKLNGESIPTSKLESRLSAQSMDPNKTVVHLMIPQNTSKDIVTKIQQIIRNQDVKRINYSTINESP